LTDKSVSRQISRQRREGLICLLDTRSVQVNRQRLAQALAAA
jgi:hypothetical protein